MIKNQPPQKPLMLAYLLFLSVCGVCYLLRNLVSAEIMAWNEIIVGVTIASYFFSLASTYSLDVSLEETMLSLCQEQRILNQKIITFVENNPGTNKPDDAQFEALIAEDQNNESDIAKANKAIRRYKAIAFWCNVCGYLTFFCILSFPIVFAFFEKSQDWYTLLAFIMVTFCEYMKSTTMVYYSELCAKAKENISNTTALLEDKTNG